MPVYDPKKFFHLDSENSDLYFSDFLLAVGDEIREPLPPYRAFVLVHFDPKNSGIDDDLVRVVCVSPGPEVGNTRVHSRKEIADHFEVRIRSSVEQVEADENRRRFEQAAIDAGEVPTETPELPGQEDGGETFPDYLRRVGGDYAESGNDATAEDYVEAADRIDRAASELDATRDYVRRASPDAATALATTTDRLVRR